MRVLLTGCSGLLGAHLAALLARQHEVTGSDRHPGWGDLPVRFLEGDLSSGRFLERLVREVRPEVVIHCAAMTDVDACERNPALARRFNSVLPGRLAQAVSPECLFIYISTDAVFAGKGALWTEQHPPAPGSVYARSKLRGEGEVQRATENHLILRTNFYGWSSGRKKTLGEWLYGALEKGEAITLFEDVFFTPIYVMDLAERVEALLALEYRGLLHLAGAERISKAGFGRILAEMAGFSLDRVRFGPVADANLAAPRSQDTSLDSAGFARLTRLSLPDCRTGLSRFLADRGLPLIRREGVPAAGGKNR